MDPGVTSALPHVRHKAWQNPGSRESGHCSGSLAFELELLMGMALQR